MEVVVVLFLMFVAYTLGNMAGFEKGIEAGRQLERHMSVFKQGDEND